MVLLRVLLAEDAVFPGVRSLGLVVYLRDYFFASIASNITGIHTG